MQGWIQKSDCNRSGFHRLVDFVEILSLQWQKYIKRFLSLTFVGGNYHPPYGRYPLFIKEHVLCSTKTDSFSSKSYSRCSIPWSVCVSSYLHYSHFINP